MLLLFLLGFLSVVSGQIPATCDSPVYCQGSLLHTVQMAGIFQDSKTFVDMKMKTSESVTLGNFESMMKSTNNAPTNEQIKSFVSENFENESELENWTPPDFKEQPKFLQDIKDIKLRSFAQKIVGLWSNLARKVKPEVTNNPSQYSLIPLPNGFIIPGGRFKEIYYWDTYWIIRGLLISEMHDTARGMIENLMYLVKKLGHVPNGSRVYYTQRSQPPFLTRMVVNYIDQTKDYGWLRKNIDTLEEELKYWLKHRSIQVRRNGITYRLFRYHAVSSGPRPESYREDVHTAQNMQDPEQMYVYLKSGAESGWDFSSRWLFDKDGMNRGNLSTINTDRVIPVDLNAILYDAFSGLASLYKSINHRSKAVYWKAQAATQDLAISGVLWNEDAGIWLDYDLQLEKHRDFFYTSNLSPLISDCCKHQRTNRSVRRILSYLKRNGIDKFKGGTPTSLVNSGEQWDYPNAWPPLQSMIVYGLMQTKNKDAERFAFNLAQVWISSNYLGFSESHEMFEKYDALESGKYGGGGEYVVQAGFGWTNGVALEFLKTYGKHLTV